MSDSKDAQLQAIFGLQVQTRRVYFHVFDIDELKAKAGEQHGEPNLRG